MTSLSDIDAFMQEENIIPDIFSEDSFEGSPALVHETDNMSLVIRIHEDDIIITYNDFLTELETSYFLLNLDNLEDMGYELANVISYLTKNEAVSFEAKTDLIKVLSLLHEDNFEEDENYSPDFFIF